MSTPSYRILSIITSPIKLQIDPQNCTWSEWQPWSSCSKSCGQGNKERIRTKETIAQDGGVDCTGPEKETFLCMCLKTGRERMRKSQAIHDLARNVTKLFLTLILYPLYICSMPFLEIKMFSKEIEKVERYLFYQCYTFF